MISLSIQEPIVRPNAPKNIYQLIVHSYHGDADREEVQTMLFKPNAVDMPKLHMLVELFELARGVCTLCTPDDWINMGYSAGIGLYGEFDHPGDVIADLLTWDITNGDRTLTTFHKYEVTFFDVNGVERRVTVTQKEETEEN